VVCIDHTGYEASLERRKLYRAIADRSASAEGLLRVIDESGEDYVYSAALFAPIALPLKLRRSLASPRGLAESTAEFDRDFVIDSFGPPTPTAAKRLARAKRKRGRPVGGRGATRSP